MGNHSLSNNYRGTMIQIALLLVYCHAVASVEPWLGLKGMYDGVSHTKRAAESKAGGDAALYSAGDTTLYHDGGFRSSNYLVYDYDYDYDYSDEHQAPSSSHQYHFNNQDQFPFGSQSSFNIQQSQYPFTSQDNSQTDQYQSDRQLNDHSQTPFSDRESSSVQDSIEKIIREKSLFNSQSGHQLSVFQTPTSDVEQQQKNVKSNEVDPFQTSFGDEEQPPATTISTTTPISTTNMWGVLKEINLGQRIETSSGDQHQQQQQQQQQTLLDINSTLSHIEDLVSTDDNEEKFEQNFLEIHKDLDSVKKLLKTIEENQRQAQKPSISIKPTSPSFSNSRRRPVTTVRTRTRTITKESKQKGSVLNGIFNNIFGK